MFLDGLGADIFERNIILNFCKSANHFYDFKIIRPKARMSTEAEFTNKSNRPEIQ
jgi:hypothetical protein